MHTLTLYYSIQNGGDGSAYPKFMESEELCNWDQDNMEGWGEPCLGSITLTSESPITCDEDIMTALEFYHDFYWDGVSKIVKNQFIEEFFPDGLPSE